MCIHKFVFAEDKPENYNPDGLTLKGRCKCGATQNAYGMRWMIPRHEHLLRDEFCKESSLDKHWGMW
uniref:Uncharacterized protein n=1 Tax=viral metagenome TaxID=1070528 RepID=A0A6M3L8K6_9ZZZZ